MPDLFGEPEHVTIWDVVRHWTGRPLLTKLLKAHGKDKIKQAALKVLEDEAVEQRPYLLAILNDVDGGRDTLLWQYTDQQLIDLAVKRSIGTQGKSRKELINALR